MIRNLHRATASYDAEAAELSDDTHTPTELTVNMESARAFVAGSIETVAHQPDFANEVAKMFADARDLLEGTQFITGTGTAEQKGTEVALTGGASEIDAAGEDVIADDLYGLVAALLARWRNQGASFQTELSLIHKLYRDWNPSGSEPPMVEGDKLVLLPFHLNSSLDPYSGIDATATATHRPLIVGDFSEFLIVDRIGSSILEYVPHLFAVGGGGRPTGQRGWYFAWRVGSKVSTIAAFRMSLVATTA